jgi:hypothetical protein
MDQTPASVSPPQQEVQEAILRSLDGDYVAMTMADAYNAAARSKLGWNDFADVMSRLKSGGLIEGRGDGFVVLYSLTSKGREAITGKR